MNRLSLTTRMSLMFMLAVTAVLTVAGVSFNHLSQHHFKMLDQEALNEKLHSTQRILGELKSTDQFGELKPELQALLGAHRNLTAVILGDDGRLLFADPGPVNVPEEFLTTTNNNFWEWQNQEQMFRGLTAQAMVTGRDKPLTVILVFDVTEHMFFFETLQRWFWIGLVISALVSVGLGWLVARSGMRPIRQVTMVAASMSAKSLKERIPLASVPKELQQMVSSFNAMLSRLDDAFVRLSNFSADIAHELRTPVSNLMIHTEVVLSRKRDIEDYEDNLYSNLDDLKRMSRMIDDMLFLAKSDNGLIPHENKPIDLLEVVEKLLEYYRLLADERGINLTVSGGGSVRGDVLMLHRAVSNLLSNALRYTPEGRTINVDIQQRNTSTFVVVENPGETIAPEHLEKLFDRFYRADPARREGSPSNAGLGLSITRSIVEAHEGKIWCTSSNRKTAFHMEFPNAGSKRA
ncbi:MULTISPECIES: heavy metal sensor histidine kinase [Pseudomonas]|jgi:two-component system, OmpR family, heavy metal sensor histidine kinase CusS|uniref:Sensor protein n=7 Tax=Pseudomonas TaxID=286 RepID=A0AAW5AJG9_9PSED|nr:MULTISPECIES: heavy metal sensor histidine kinase [Pseudomonas]SUD45007.1 heavy metal sensor signal transduction histidine kinase [Pseudomonas fluorescens]KAA0943638.1 heavy metal sensor histidine kinase [Pseudomonas sp. ANT_H4]KAA0946166.1 heavy metal sensor histidine kinase [Pseudomonas sp. ANT_H14]KAA0973861.1 heavy metal sensor histidine kinase [Pseudomonas sp. ANT_H12B]MBI6568030.1 heavy metal sensor histidine kinase [Pseudomonas synxantha]